MVYRMNSECDFSITFERKYKMSIGKSYDALGELNFAGFLQTIDQDFK